MSNGDGAPAGVGFVRDYAQSQAQAAAAWDAPAQAVAETFPRRMATAESPNLASGVLTCTALPLPHGTAISAVSVFTGHVGGTGVTHGWVCILDHAAMIIAASEDQGTYAWPASTTISLDMIEPVTTTVGGIYWLGVSITASGVMPNFVSTAPMLNAVTALPPLLTGTSTTGLGGMKEPGTQMAPVTSPTGWAIYGIIS